jgi:hypothetical protein
LRAASTGAAPGPVFAEDDGSLAGRPVNAATFDAARPTAAAPRLQRTTAALPDALVLSAPSSLTRPGSRPVRSWFLHVHMQTLRAASPEWATLCGCLPLSAAVSLECAAGFHLVLAPMMTASREFCRRHRKPQCRSHAARRRAFRGVGGRSSSCVGGRDPSPETRHERGVRLSVRGAQAAARAGRRPTVTGAGPPASVGRRPWRQQIRRSAD